MDGLGVEGLWLKRWRSRGGGLRVQLGGLSQPGL